MTPLDTSKSWVSSFEQSILAQAFVLLMELSREWLLLSTLLKHETVAKALVCLHRNESRASRLCDSVGTDEVVASIIVVELAFVFVSTHYYS